MHHHLSFTSDSSEDDQVPDSTPVHSDEEEHFQTLPLDDKHWMAEIVPERTFCIHKNDLPTMYANTHALMETVTLSHTWTA